jgi:hypothetical protein
MPNRSGNRGQGPPDTNEVAFRVFQIAMRDVEEKELEQSDKPKKNEATVSLGRLGGLKGGVARAKSLTPEERRAIARRAAESRWKK